MKRQKNLTLLFLALGISTSLLAGGDDKDGSGPMGCAAARSLEQDSFLSGLSMTIDALDGYSVQTLLQLYHKELREKGSVDKQGNLYCVMQAFTLNDGYRVRTLAQIAELPDTSLFREFIAVQQKDLSVTRRHYDVSIEEEVRLRNGQEVYSNWCDAAARYKREGRGTGGLIITSRK